MELTPDVINGLFEVVGSLFILLSVHKVWKDKSVKGVSWLHVSFFVGWGVWNLYFYPHLDQWWSFGGGIVLAGVQSLWLALLIYYSYEWDPGQDNLERGPWKETYTGARFYLMDPRPEEIVFEDVVHSLSMQCRYTGHCLVWYSVAEHCCLLCDYVKEQGRSARDQYEMLMHDAPEFATGDISRPMKYGIPGLKPSLEHINVATAKAFGCQYPEPTWLKKLDARMICDERAQNMVDSGNDWNHDKLEPLGIKLKYWGQERAKAEFTRRYNRLTRQIAKEKANG